LVLLIDAKPHLPDPNPNDLHQRIVMTALMC